MDNTERIEALEKKVEELENDSLAQYDTDPHPAEQPKGSYICGNCKKDWGSGPELTSNGSTSKEVIYQCHVYKGGCGIVAVTWQPKEHPKGYWRCSSCYARSTVSCCDNPNLVWIDENHESYDPEYRESPPGPADRIKALKNRIHKTPEYAAAKQALEESEDKLEKSEPAEPKETELKPCPFCGGEADTEEDDTTGGNAWSYRVACEECNDGATKHYSTEAEATAAWNLRDDRPATSKESECGYDKGGECNCIAEGMEKYIGYLCEFTDPSGEKVIKELIRIYYIGETPYYAANSSEFAEKGTTGSAYSSDKCRLHPQTLKLLAAEAEVDALKAQVKDYESGEAAELVAVKAAAERLRKDKNEWRDDWNDENKKRKVAEAELDELINKLEYSYGQTDDALELSAIGDTKIVELRADVEAYICIGEELRAELSAANSRIEKLEAYKKKVADGLRDCRKENPHNSTGNLAKYLMKRLAILTKEDKEKS